MKRPLSLLVWLPATVLVALVVISAVAWRSRRPPGFDRPITIMSVTAADPGARQSLYDVARMVGPAEPPPARAAPSVRRLEASAFIAEIERTTALSRHQRARLTDTLALAATIQRGIDTTADPDERTELQRRLDNQVRARLQMILPKQALAAALREVDTSIPL